MSLRNTKDRWRNWVSQNYGTRTRVVDVKTGFFNWTMQNKAPHIYAFLYYYVVLVNSKSIMKRFSPCTK